MRESRHKQTTGVDGGDVPLVVDVDGTLVAGDLLIEGLLRLFRKSPLKALWLSFRLFGVGRGRAALKRRLAVAMPVEPETLVLHAEVEEKVGSALRSGRPVWLASGSDELLVRPLAKFIGADGYLASDGKTNLVGLEKARALVERFGSSGFDYIGNERRDLVVWEQARRAVEHRPPAARSAPGGAIRTSTRTASCARCSAGGKVWRREKATAMVFGELPAMESVADAK